MIVTDLTGTTWVFNTNPDVSMMAVGPLALNFTSNSSNYVTIRYGKDGPASFIVYNTGSWPTQVYVNGTWIDETYRTIEITGGTDATNASLISWLEANATLVKYSLNISYNNTDLYATNDSKTITLNTTGKSMQGDVVIKYDAPSGKKTITSTAEIDVSQYATAQVDSTDLIASNIRIGTTILGVIGTMQGMPTAPTTPTNAILFYSLNSFTLETFDRAKHWSSTLQYSTSGSSWTTWSGTTVLSASYSSSTNYFMLYIRGSSNTIISGSSSNYRWVLTGRDITCVGNMNTLLNYSSPSSASLGNYAFAYLFYDCGNVNFDVTLPATTLTTYCYSYMFYGCKNMQKAPALPATTLQTYCYQYMFYGSGIRTLPRLKATTLTNYCYYYMFYGCKGIKLATSSSSPYTTAYRIPTSGTGSSGTNSLTYMFAYTGGTTFTGSASPSINTTYYTSNTLVG